MSNHHTGSDEQKNRGEEILGLLAEHRFATTKQLARFTRAGYGTERTALRRTQTQLTTLTGRDLVAHLERRVGGWQGGSSNTIWYLTTKGIRTMTGRRVRAVAERLSTDFLEHQLAVTETRLIIQETTSRTGQTFTVHPEPECWRHYPGPLAATKTLKPDLALTISSDQFEDHYFIEIDRATENPGRVIRKSQQYETYRRTGREQAATGIYPAIIWLVPNTQRKQQVTSHICQVPSLPNQLFHVLLPTELPGLIRDGPGSSTPTATG